MENTSSQPDQYSCHTKKDLISGLTSLGVSLSWNDKRTKATILDFIQELPSETQDLLLQRLAESTSTSTSASKRHRPGHSGDNSHKRPRQEEDLGLTELELRKQNAQFPHLPSDAEQKRCYSGYVDATSNEALRREVCLACGRELWAREGRDCPMNEIPHREHLKPQSPHRSHELTDGLLLVPGRVVVKDGVPTGWFCLECLSALEADKQPALSLANGMWVGAIPDALQGLTIPEQMLLAVLHPRICIIKLFPRDPSSFSLDPSTLQHGLMGNVTTFEQNLPEVVKMLEGKLLPRPTSILASTIAVTYIGPGKLPKAWLKQTFRVRRPKVLAAFNCLKYETKHPAFQDLELDQSVLDSLPDDDIPREILALMTHEPNMAAAEEEAETYVPSSYPQEPNNSQPQASCNQSSSQAQQQDGPRDLDANVPDVIQLKYLGAEEIDLSNLSTEDMLLYGLVNTATSASSERPEGGYAVRHSRHAVSEFPQRVDGSSGNNGGQSAQLGRNYCVYAFPWLYPWGEGGIEAARRVPVSMAQHVQHNLQYYDRRFATHHTWVFVFFSILQKRQAMLGARVQMRRRDFDRATQLFSTITRNDLLAAAEEESKGLAISNPAIRALRHLMHTSSSKVMGSDASRFSYRSEIWSTALYLNPPSLWVTINPADLHDPVMQVLAGEQIDMDHFQSSFGPNVERRAQNLAKNPYAGEMFFDFVITLILETLFGIKSSSWTTSSDIGVLGFVNAYYGVVEAQGRGSLHVHMLVWLHKAPAANVISDLFQTEEFRQRIVRFVDANIRAHLDGMSENLVRTQAREADIAWSRPPDPRSPTFDEDVTNREWRLVRSQQVHKCKRTTCLQPDRRTGQLVCKRHHPFKISPETLVDSDGNVTPKRTYEDLNTWNPSILLYAACNNDIKFISNGVETRSCAWYITAYQTKKQSRSHNLSALLADRLVNHIEGDDYIDDMRERNRSNQTAKKRGSSSQDWNSQTDSDSDSDSQSDDSDDSRSTSSLHESDQSDTEETVTVETSTEGELVYRSQVDDYRFRGMELQNFNFLDFMVHTREEKISSGRPKAQDSTSSHRGPSLNMRSKYLDGHPRAKTHQRIARHSNHNKLPNIIGAWLPRNNDPELADFYSVSMLALLKPWRKLTEFETPGESWSSVFQSFLRSTTPRNLELIANAQYYYSCKDAAKQERDRWRNGEKTHGDFDPSCFTEDSEGELQETGISQARPITEQDLDAVRRLKETGAEACHGVVAVQKGRLVGLLPKDTSQSWVVDQAQLRFATSEDIHQIDSWKKTLSAEAQALRLNSTTTMQVDNDDHGDVSALDQISDTHGQGGSAVQPINAILPEVVPSVDVSRMNQDQLRAYTIIKRHLEANLAGQGRPQLLMQLLGEGGTGKSTVIHAIIDLFRALGVSERLVTAAPTGIAASLINGSTLHTLCRIRPGAAKTTSDDIPLKTLEFLHQSWRHVEYFIIDEISMVSRSFFAQISAAISAAKKDDTYPFGGIVVIICGDFHQFGPVARPEYEALYFPNNLPFRKPKSKEKVHDIMTGGEIFEKFTTVVILKEQCRMRDAEWNDLLRHARHGKCTPAHLALLNSLVVSPKGAGLSDVTNPVWQKATLITPRHGVRIAWNKQANRRHCRENHRQLFISVAYETVNKRELTLGEKYAAETRKASQRNEISEKGRLPDKVEIAIGMEVMVTTNIETELDLANGARGIVEDIIFDPKEDIDPASQEVELSHLPLCVLVKLFRTKAKTLPGLAENVVPITPMVQKYNLPNGKKGEKRVTRRQLPITSAYAFTDYRSQGQTMERVVVDLAPPPYGKLSPFNAYVAMSRSRGRDTIRLLREFDPTLFTTLPSEVLETAEKTFYELDKKTIVDL